MPYGWKGNCRSGIVLAGRDRRKWFIHLQAQSLNCLLKRWAEHLRYARVFVNFFILWKKASPREKKEKNWRLTADTATLMKSTLVWLYAMNTETKSLNAHYMKDIVALERVQSRFTKRLPGMKALTYHQRLVKLRLQSLEFRCIRLDLGLQKSSIFFK